VKSSTWYAISGFLYVLLSYQIFTIGALFGNLNLFVLFTDEGGAFEVVGAFGFFVTAILFGAAFVRSGQQRSQPTPNGIKRLFFLMLVCVFLFGAGEEVSWGQWLFGFDPPETIGSTNRQGELNIHNLRTPDGGTLAAPMLRVFHLFWLTFVVLVPAAASYEPAHRLLDGFVPVVPLVLGLPLLLNYVLMRGLILATKVSFQPYHYRLGELHESNLAVLFVMVAAYIVFEMLAPVTPLPETHQAP
jgi:hypothetical protein